MAFWTCLSWWTPSMRASTGATTRGTTEAVLLLLLDDADDAAAALEEEKVGLSTALLPSLPSRTAARSSAERLWLSRPEIRPPLPAGCECRPSPTNRVAPPPLLLLLPLPPLPPPLPPHVPPALLLGAPTDRSSLSIREIATSRASDAAVASGVRSLGSSPKSQPLSSGVGGPKSHEPSGASTAGAEYAGLLRLLLYCAGCAPGGLSATCFS